MSFALSKWERRVLKFWPVLQAVTSMSKDPSTKIGAIALDTNMNVVATGYNGFPRGVTDSVERYADRETKYKLVAHAEQNLIAQAAYSGVSLCGATLLVSNLYPCSSCAKSIIQSGITRVVAPRHSASDRWLEESKWAKLLFDESGVEVICLEELLSKKEKDSAD